ncbi:MAG TPA: DMT family transporter [Candidatus Acidoferrum sp.]|jgi:transporter family-2 protein|nr:DMT family transporter [Candidatus Acidoferrum sp.]
MNAFLSLGLLALVAGALIPVQATANTALSKSLQGNIPYSALTLFIVGVITAIIAILFTGAKLPAWKDFGAAPWWSYISGAIIATYVLTITFLIPRIGVGRAIALIVTGQIIAAMLIDQFGFMHAPRFPLTSERIFGAALMVIGVFLATRR